MQRQKVLFVVLISFLVMVCSGSQAKSISPRYSDTLTISATLTITDGNASCYGSVKPTDNSNNATVKVKLQRLEGGDWNTIFTWTASSQNGRLAGAGGSKTVSSGYSYRVLTEGEIKAPDGEILESPSVTSAVKDY